MIKRSIIFLLIIGHFLIAQYVPFKVDLNVLERMAILSILPERASYAHWKIINDLRNELAPTDDELRAINAKYDDAGRMSGDWTKVPEKEYILGEIAVNIITDTLKRMNNQNSLGSEHISIYEKFVFKNGSD
jgi:hypothetical protein